MSHLEHLLKLAQKTGDTLIIHNEQDRDMVIMDVTMYEVLHDMCAMQNDKSSGFDCGECCEHGVDFSDMTEGDMLDKINQDIAIWREYQQEDEQLNRIHVLEDDLTKKPFDPFEEDFVHDSSWHKAGDILQNKQEELISSFDNEQSIHDNNEHDLFQKSTDPHYDELGELGIKNTQKQDIPFVSHDGIDMIEEVSIDDEEPVFFEEPV